MAVSKTFIFYAQALIVFLCLWLAYWILFSGLSWLRARKNNQPFIPLKFESSFIYSAAFACLGFTIGLLVGFTTSPIAQFIIPALLTFLGGFVTILISKDKTDKVSERIIVAAALIIIPIFLVYGLELGTAEKDKATRIDKQKELYYMELEEKIKYKYK